MTRLTLLNSGSCSGSSAMLWLGMFVVWFAPLLSPSLSDLGSMGLAFGSFLEVHLYMLFLLMIIIKLVCLLIAIAYFTLAERKIMAAVQRRFGPNVVGFWGLLQPLADGLKLFAKELVIPTHSNSRLFVAAPMAVLSLAFIAWAVIPFSIFDHSEVGSLWDLGQSVLGSVKGPTKVETVAEELSRLQRELDALAAPSVPSEPHWARTWSSYILGERITQLVIANPKTTAVVVGGACLVIPAAVGYGSLWLQYSAANTAAIKAVAFAASKTSLATAAQSQAAAATAKVVAGGVAKAAAANVTASVAAVGAKVAQHLAAKATVAALSASKAWASTSFWKASALGMKVVITTCFGAG